MACLCAERKIRSQHRTKFRQGQYSAIFVREKTSHFVDIMIAEIQDELIRFRDDRNGPWGPGEHNLSNIKLTFEQKLWFIHEIINNHCKTKNLVERFNLKDRTIRDWCLKYKAGEMQLRRRPCHLYRLRPRTVSRPSSV